MSDLDLSDLSLKRFWKHLNKYSVPVIASLDEYHSRVTILDELNEKVHSGLYTPSPPRYYLSDRKSFGVARFVPCFNPVDYSVYFACVAAVDEVLSTYRAPNTFGGWTLGGSYRKKEELEVQRYLDNIRSDTWLWFDYDEPYALASYNPSAWLENWNKYWTLLHTHLIHNSERYIVTFDIANFYDNIELSRLERALRRSCPNALVPIEILLYFLRYWDRESNSYSPSSKGLPQDVVGDCSRVLANYYISSYDHRLINSINDIDTTYFRYADDMVIVSSSPQKLEKSLFRASELLNGIGLNINSQKVKLFTASEFQDHWRFGLLCDLMNYTEVGAVLENVKAAISQRPGRLSYIVNLTLARSWHCKESKPDIDFIQEYLLSNIDHLFSLSPSLLRTLLCLSSNPTEIADKVCALYTSRPYTQPLLRLIKSSELLLNDSEGRLSTQIIGNLKSVIGEDSVLINEIAQRKLNSL